MTPGTVRLTLGACLLATAFMARDVDAQGVTAGLAPDSISGMAGQRKAVALQVNMGGSGLMLGSYSVSITWDSTIARVDSVRLGAFGGTVNYVSGGEVRLAQAVGPQGGMGGTVSLAQLYFRIVGATIGQRTPVTLAFTDLVATDFTDLRIGAQIVNGVVRVLPPAVLVHFTPDSTYERVGYKPVIDLTADVSATGDALGSYAASFTWDPTVMVFDSIRAGDYVMPQWNQVGAGELRLSAADAQGLGGAPSLARLYFSFINESFPRVTSLSLSVTEMSAAISFANLLPGVTTRVGKAVIGGVLRGDIDIDGSIAALDAQLILQGAVGLTLPGGLPGVPHGDADCGGTLQARDAQIVLNQIVGNPVTQFCVATIK